ncbi:hypothetical protein Vretifemale_5937, partial [Volvox reticuliferus]
APWRQARALQALSRLAGPDGSWLLVRDPSVALGPVRSEQLLLTLEGEKNNSSGLGNGAGKDWASAGYDADAMAALLSEARRAMAHRNAVGPLEIPGAEQVMTILRSAVDSVTDAAAAVSVPSSPRTSAVAPVRKLGAATSVPPQESEGAGAPGAHEGRAMGAVSVSIDSTVPGGSGATAD